MVVLDTSYVVDVLGLRTRRAGTSPTRDSVRVLIPDANAGASGFHDNTLVDMADVAGPPVSVGDLGLLRWQWPVSVVSGMSQRQTE